ncbi:MAG: CoA-binding protein [Candidatus Woesearchaeota archaeon]|nr:MAG: CoA-binding protein [Candidatus Woesearchaeota archaeon]
MNLEKFFTAKNIAIIGVSQNPNKVGHVIFRNFIDGGFLGKLFVVNPTVDSILNHVSYKSILDIKEKIDLAIIAIPAEGVLNALEECGKNGIKQVIIITSGFSEIGNNELEDKLKKILKRYGILCIGPNCLGIFDSSSRIDSLFLPRYRLKRPREGHLGFISQSGAVGSTILDLATSEGYGCSKFISYGNATNVDESDLIEFLGNDRNTKVICVYIEGVKNGKKFMKICSEVSKKKPIVIVKGGKSEEGNKATLSHTGSLAGNALVYSAAFKQSGVIEVDNLENLFDVARTLEKCIKPKGDRVQIITNGGGYGIMATDAVIQNCLRMAQLEKKTADSLKKVLPKNATTGNPIDLVGDADTSRYKKAIDCCLNDKSSDILLVIALYQVPLLTTDVIDVITEANDLKKKPILVVSVGGEFTEVLKKSLEENNVPCFNFPHNAVNAIRALVDYQRD